MANDFLIIEHDFRSIRIPEKKKFIGVMNDANVNRLCFKAPRYYGDVDLSEFEFRINFINANGDEDIYPVDDLVVSNDEEDTLVFSWLVGRVACAYEGEVEFSVHAYFIEDDIVEREYYTLAHTMVVLPTIIVDAALIFVEYPDAIQQLIDRIIKLRAEVTFGEGMDVDSELDLESDNPVRNSVITDALKNALDVTDGILSIDVGV